MQRQHHGEQPHWMLVTLASMLGQIGLPGGGFGLSYHYGSGGSPSANSPVLPGITDGGKAMEGAAWLSSSGAARSRWHGSSTCSRIRVRNSTSTAHERNTRVKMAYWVGGNPFVHHQDRNRMLQAWRKLETFVVQDFLWTPTARHADIVLPATSSYERNDIEQVGDYPLRYIVAMKKVIDPIFEARNDFDIFSALAARLGKGKEFTENKGEMDWIKFFYEEARTQAKAKKVPMPEFDTFWNGDGFVEFPVTEEANEFHSS